MSTDDAEARIARLSQINAALSQSNQALVSAHEIERRQAQEDLARCEARVRFALETCQTGAWDLDLLDHTAYRTPLHDRIFGYKALLPSWTYEMFLEHVLPEDRPQVDRSFRDAMATQSAWSFECRIRRADGEVRWIWAAGDHERNVAGKPVRMAGVVQDITERKQTQEELQKYSDTLEERVRQRTRELETEIAERKEAEKRIERLNADLQHRAAQLADSNKELESFCYSVSHDLRAPLRHVHGYVEMLSKATQGQLSDTAGRYLKVISDASVEMGQLIDDLLAFSRMSRAEMRETTVDLNQLVQQTLHGLEMETKGRNILWKIAPLPPAVADSPMLKQVFSNLIGNAIKYSRRRDPAEIEIGCAGEENGRPIYFVRDNGAGFDMRYAHKLFGVFQRLHRAEEFEGTGIGLATVRRILTRHGDRIWTEGVPDRGATFYFTLKPSREHPTQTTKGE